MQFRENDCRLRRGHGPAVMAILRRSALNMVRTVQQNFRLDLSIGLLRDKIGRNRATGRPLSTTTPIPHASQQSQLTSVVPSHLCYSLDMKVPSEIRELAARVGYAVLLFLGSLVVVAVFIGSNVLLEWLIGFAVNKETRTYDVIKTVLDILLIGFALVGTTIGGAIIVLKEIWSSVKSFWNRTED